MNHAGLGIADDLGAVGQAQGQPLGLGCMHAHAQHLAVAQGRKEALGTL